MKYVIIFLLLVPALAFCEGQSSNSELNTIHFWEGHSDAFLLNQVTMVNPDGCTKPNTWYALVKSHPHYEEIYSLLLMAKAANKKVTFILSGCYSGAYPKIRDVYL